MTNKSNPDYALELRNEASKPKESSTLEREAYHNRYGDRNKVSETTDFKGIWGRNRISKAYSGFSIKQALMAGAMAAATAAIVNAVLFFIFHAAGIIVDTVYIQPNQPMTVVPIIISSVVPTLLGTLVFFLFEKNSSNGFKNFRILALVLMFVSFINPFMGIPGISIPYGIVLNIMHVVVVAALLYFLAKSKAKNS